MTSSPASPGGQLWPFSSKTSTSKPSFFTVISPAWWGWIRLPWMTGCGVCMLSANRGHSNSCILSDTQARRRAGLFHTHKIRILLCRRRKTGRAGSRTRWLSIARRSREGLRPYCLGGGSGRHVGIGLALGLARVRPSWYIRSERSISLTWLDSTILELGVVSRACAKDGRPGRGLT
jgi:hypothetical protein